MLLSDATVPLYDPLTFYQQVRAAACGHTGRPGLLHAWTAPVCVAAAVARSLQARPCLLGSPAWLPVV